jgi:hypothetical protein
MMEHIFSDENEPFWRSAKEIELGAIEPQPFGEYIERQFKRTGKKITPAAVDAVLETTRGHPYATQELCYFLWQDTPADATATDEHVAEAVAKVLNSEHAHFSLVWEDAPAHQRLLLRALAEEPGHPISAEYRRRHALPGASSVQRALGALEKAELVGRRKGEAWISEPFLAQWVLLNDA